MRMDLCLHLALFRLTFFFFFFFFFFSPDDGGGIKDSFWTSSGLGALVPVGMAVARATIIREGRKEGRTAMMAKA